MKDIINFGIIGCGKIGKRHADVISNIEEAKLVAVCDIKKERALELAKQHNCEAYFDYGGLLNHKDIDVANICTPSGLHAEMSIKAAKYKKNVICEKPMALSLKDCDKMIESCRKNNVRLFIVKQNRYNPPIIRLKEAIDFNKLGKIYLISSHVFWNRPQRYYDEEDWRGTNKLDGGALMTQSSHFIDLMQWIGGTVKSVYAKMDTFNHKIETEDTGIVVLRFENGAMGVMEYTTCIYDKNYEGSLSVFGNKGSIKIGGQYLNEIEYWNVEGFPKGKIKKCNPPNQYGFYQGSSSNHDKVIQNVIDALKYKTDNSIHGDDGRKSVEIILAAKKSAKTGKEVFLPLKE